MLSMKLLDSASVLYNNSYYTVVASIFLVSAASCKAICEVTSRPTERGRGGGISPGPGLVGGPEHLSIPMQMPVL